MSDDLLKDSLLSEVPASDDGKILDPCLLTEKLGEGGMGSVYRGRHLRFDIDVAVKCLKPSLAEENPDLVTRFQREAKVAAGISSENLIRVFDVNSAHGLHYMVMEFVEGEDLRRRVTRKGALDEREAGAIILAAARGVSAAHRQGVVHRDIKPDNILISTRGEVKVADLGLARAAEAIDTLKTGTRTVMGTPSYMPPEQFESAALVGPPGDVYALGATLYFLLSGEDGIERGSLVEVMRRVCLDPFPSLADKRPDLPALDALIRRATDHDPARRFADAESFERALQEIVDPAERATLHDAAAKGATPTMVSPPPPRKTALSEEEQAREEARRWAAETQAKDDARRRTEAQRIKKEIRARAKAEREKAEREKAEREEAKRAAARPKPVATQAQPVKSKPKKTARPLRWLVVLLLIGVAGAGGYRAYERWQSPKRKERRELAELAKGLTFIERNAQGFREFSLDIDPTVVLIEIPTEASRWDATREATKRNGRPTRSRSRATSSPRPS